MKLLLIMLLITIVFGVVSYFKLKRLIKEGKEEQKEEMKKAKAMDVFSGLYINGKIELQGRWVAFIWMEHYYLGKETEYPYNELVMIEIIPEQYEEAVKHKVG